ncbi:flavodoxin family protein [Geomonas sp. RF6]|uniref:flavodoxin family protein n=1 Tax=Geomonas sp. RF6 TaxID=2897342 RepID=UPI001E4DF117|nr:flavodoxin family protein [Geomonas sp. RF6]UFS72391.1 flavodoxin family protein [Geomonas sp. RF6]
MKIIAINGSPRGMEGNTGRLLEEVIAGAREAGAEIEVVNLAQEKIRPCLACDNCHRTGTCLLKDSFEEVKEKLLACDGFILASPNYIFSVTAQMKAFMDRCCGMIHCMSLEGKYAALVESSGSGEDEEVLDAMERFVNMLGALSVGGVGSPAAGARTFPDEENLFARARELGRELCASVREKKGSPEQQAFLHAFRERMQRLVSYMGEEWPYERAQWGKK